MDSVWEQTQINISKGTFGERKDGKKSSEDHTNEHSDLFTEVRF
jgi:hypothetical protein